jgi:queuine/archaeosine tRNA-ribosyltransferase
VNQQELLGLVLLSEHNVRFLLDLAAAARVAVERGELAAFAASARERLREPGGAQPAEGPGRRA